MPALLAILLAAVTSSYRLVDSTGEPVRGATVRVVGGVSSAVTDDEGRFRLDPGAAAAVRARRVQRPRGGVGRLCPVGTKLEETPAAET